MNRLRIKDLKHNTQDQQLVQLIRWYMNPVLLNSKTHCVSNINGGKRRRIAECDLEEWGLR